MRFKKYINEKEERWVYGTKNKKWYLVKSGDRDFKSGISQKEFKKIGKKASRKKYLKLEHNINEAPIKTKGWTEESIKKFEKTIGIKATEKGFFDACVLRMTPKEGFDKKKAEGFCASLKDLAHDSVYWRGKSKTKKEIKKDVKEKPYKGDK